MDDKALSAEMAAGAGLGDSPSLRKERERLPMFGTPVPLGL